MSNTRNQSLTAMSVGSVMALCIVLQAGASVALARAVAPSEAFIEPEEDIAVTPSAQAMSQTIRRVQRRGYSVCCDQPEEAWAKAELDYSSMDRATHAATSAPAIQVSEDDTRMYAGLSSPSLFQDDLMDADETVAIDRSYIARAEQAAARAPMVVLSADSLRALAGIQTHFPRSIEFDEE